jgi:ABC-type iron transport system FetAB ATPase subunit
VPVIEDGGRQTSPVLEVRELAVAPRDVPLLRDVSLSLQRGELLAIVGPSGCGKTSLLRAIAGLDDAAAGEVRFHGRSPDDVGWPAYRCAVTMLQQHPIMLDDSVLENLARPWRHRSVARTFERGRAVDMLETVGLTERCLAQQARTLSLGEQQRIALLRAILIEPEVLLLDEPTSALVRREGRSAVVVTHDVRQADRLCDAKLDLRAYAIRDAQHRGSDDAR